MGSYINLLSHQRVVRTSLKATADAIFNSANLVNFFKYFKCFLCFLRGGGLIINNIKVNKF